MKKHELLQKAMKDYPNGTKLNHKLSGTFNCELPYFIDGTNSVSDRNGRCLFASSEAPFSGWAEIVTDRKPEKDFAVVITNEFEYEQVKKAFKDLGFGYSSSPYSSWGKQTIYAKCLPMLSWGVNLNEKHFTAISFDEFLKKHNLRSPLLTSEDGVELFEGDRPCWVILEDGVYNICLESNLISINNICMAPHYKIFSTKQAALDFIDKMNKPKSVNVPLFDVDNQCIIYSENNQVRIWTKGGGVCIKHSDIEDIYHALKTINNEN